MRFRDRPTTGGFVWLSMQTGIDCGERRWMNPTCLGAFWSVRNDGGHRCFRIKAGGSKPKNSTRRAGKADAASLKKDRPF